MKMLTGKKSERQLANPMQIAERGHQLSTLLVRRTNTFGNFEKYNLQFRQIHLDNWYIVKKADVEAACGRPAVECLISQELARGIWLQPIWLTLKNQLNSIALEKTNTPNG